VYLKIGVNVRMYHLFKMNLTFSTDYSRNRIRHNIVPEALKVNPGLKTVVRKMIKL
jgi:tRNA(Ile)-lysidine synthase TilS/MesJ